jgi:propanol-preferring alcohol dehydrogenase
MGIQIAKAMGFRVIGIDDGDEKRTLCLDLGCEEFVDFTKVEDVAQEVIRITGHGAHGCFVTAGSTTAYKTAPAMLRIGGRLMCIGLRESRSCYIVIYLISGQLQQEISLQVHTL